MSVSSLKLINEDWFLMLMSGVLIFLFIYFKKRLDFVFLITIFYWTLVNFIAFITFNESLSSLSYTLLGSLMRLTIGYLLLKLAGPLVFFRAEKVSFWVLVIGFFIFLGIEFIGPMESILKGFNLGAMDKQAESGGWNILVYARNPWQPFRFSGYAWEAGSAALIIIFSLIITILRDGYKIDYRKAVYVILLIFTFSTAGYFALLMLITHYIVSVGIKKYAIITIVLIFFSVPVLSVVYQQKFISGKIEKYIKRSENNQKYGFENSVYDKVTRVDFAILSIRLVNKWPLGYGISKSGFITNRYGVPLVGSNSLFLILVTWGFVGFFFMLYSFIKYFQLLSNNKNVGTYFFLLLALLIVFFSNPIERSPLFYGLIFFPHIFQKLIIKRNDQSGNVPF